MKVLVLSDSDSRIKWSNYLVHNINPKSIVYQTSIIIINNNIIDFDIIILALGGGANYKFLLKFNEYIIENNPTKRPIIISGFNGSTDSDNIHALLCRMGSDFICLNSKKDYDSFSTHLKKLEFSNKTLFLSGLAKEYRINEYEILKKDKIVFFAQPDIPKTKIERIYIVKKLEELAGIFYNKKIFIKPRSKKGELDITHKEKYYYQDILQELNIENVCLIYDDVEEVLKSTYLSITVGSTVALESIYCEIDTVILSDLGIRQEYGNHHFMGSGCLMSFNNIINNKRPIINEQWKEEYILINHCNFDILVENVMKKIFIQSKSNKILPLEPLFYREENATFFYSNNQRINNKQKNKIQILIVYIKNKLNRLKSLLFTTI